MIDVAKLLQQKISAIFRLLSKWLLFNKKEEEEKKVA